MKQLLHALPLALLAACSSPSDTDEAATPSPDAAASATAEPTPAAASADAKTLTLDGLGDLVIGQPVPEGSSFAERGAQIPGTSCRTLSSPDYPGVYAMTVDGDVKRISVSDESDVKLVEGIGAGSTLDEVRGAFPGFRETPHKYWGPEGKDLIQPGSDPRLRFEIDPEGKVAQVHVGVAPELSYVEGCA